VHDDGTIAPLVLIVDDNERGLKLARDVLRAAGFRTLEAQSGAEAIALALALSSLPDVILMDIRLPDMDGTEAVRRLDDEARTAPIPVVALSALPLDEGDDWFVAAGFGFAGYVEKPIDIDAFPDQVRDHCKRLR
jgi:two-component system, cell cycle response regulator DivK